MTSHSQRSKPSIKKATNLSLSADVLADAKALNINISKICDEHLREVVAEEQRRQWKVRYAGFVSAYNESVCEEGLPLAQWQAF